MKEEIKERKERKEEKKKRKKRKKKEKEKEKKFVKKKLSVETRQRKIYGYDSHFKALYY